jgi:hypothetical protein
VSLKTYGWLTPTRAEPLVQYWLLLDFLRVSVWVSVVVKRAAVVNHLGHHVSGIPVVSGIVEDNVAEFDVGMDDRTPIRSLVKIFVFYCGVGL